MAARGNNLFHQLIALPHPPAAQVSRALTVAPMHALPANIRFGPLSPPALGGSRFTGATVANPLSPLRQLASDFQAPGFGATGFGGGPAVSPAALTGAV